MSDTEQNTEEEEFDCLKGTFKPEDRQAAENIVSEDRYRQQGLVSEDSYRQQGLQYQRTGIGSRDYSIRGQVGSRDQYQRTGIGSRDYSIRGQVQAAGTSIRGLVQAAETTQYQRTGTVKEGIFDRFLEVFWIFLQNEHDKPIGTPYRGLQRKSSPM